MGFTPAAAQMGLARRGSFGLGAEQALAQAESLVEEGAHIEAEGEGEATPEAEAPEATVLTKELLLCFREAGGAREAASPEEAGLLWPSPGWMRTQPYADRARPREAAAGGLDRMPLPGKAKVVDAPSGLVHRPHQQQQNHHQHHGGQWSGQQHWQTGGGSVHGGAGWQQWQHQGQHKGGWQQWNGGGKKAWPHQHSGAEAQAQSADKS